MPLAYPWLELKIVNNKIKASPNYPRNVPHFFFFLHCTWIYLAVSWYTIQRSTIYLFTFRFAQSLLPRLDQIYNAADPSAYAYWSYHHTLQLHGVDFSPIIWPQFANLYAHLTRLRRTEPPHWFVFHMDGWADCIVTPQPVGNTTGCCRSPRVIINALTRTYGVPCVGADTRLSMHQG